MSGERLAALALFSYPAGARAARGDEMLATLLLVPATLVATAGPPPGEASLALLAAVLFAALLVVVAAVALLPTDPRLAIAGAVSVSNAPI